MQIQLLQNIQKLTPITKNCTAKPAFKGVKDTFALNEGTCSNYEKQLAEYANYPVSTYEKMIDDARAKQNSSEINQNEAPNECDFANILHSLIKTDYANAYFKNNEINQNVKNKTMLDSYKIIEKFTLAMRVKGAKFNYNDEKLQKLAGSIPMMYWARSFDKATILAKLNHLDILSKEN